jgi:hypothetical protein
MCWRQCRFKSTLAAVPHVAAMPLEMHAGGIAAMSRVAAMPLEMHAGCIAAMSRVAAMPLCMPAGGAAAVVSGGLAAVRACWRRCRCVSYGGHVNACWRHCRSTAINKKKRHALPHSKRHCRLHIFSVRYYLVRFAPDDQGPPCRCS